MAISFEMEAHSEVAARNVFATIADLSSWDEYAGVLVRGPARLVAAGDRVDLSVKVMRREIMQRWAAHQMTHLLSVAAANVERAG